MTLFFRRPRNGSILLILATAVAVLGLLTLPAGCRRPETMSLEEAQTVAITVAQTDFIAPPRRIVDVLALLSESGTFDASVSDRFRSRLDEPAPAASDPDQWLRFYRRRGEAALELGLGTQAVKDFRKAMAIAKTGGRHQPGLLFQLGKAEAGIGNIMTGIRLMEKSQSLRRTPRNYQHLVRLYLRIGDFDKARALAGKGAALARTIKLKKGKKNRPTERIRAHEALMEASILEARGMPKAAEPFRRTHLQIMAKQMAKHPRGAIEARISLAANLKKQGRLVEAEKEIRRAIREAVGLGGQNAEFTVKAVLSLGKIILAQARIDEAVAVAEAAADLLARSGLENQPAMVSRTFAFLINVLIEKGNFSEAVAAFDQLSRRLSATPRALGRVTTKPRIMLALIQTGRAKEALSLIEPSLDTLTSRLDTGHRAVARRIGLRAMARHRLGRIGPALNDFSSAVPVLLENIRSQNDQVSRSVLEAYMTLLGETGKNEAVNESFRIAEALRGVRVRRAMGAAAARRSGIDPVLGELARQEQDLEQRQETVEALLLDILSLPAKETDPAAAARLEADLKRIKNARQSLLAEISRRFPRYADLRDPRPAAPAEIRGRLMAKEAMIAVYTGAFRSWIWAVSPGRATAFAMVPFGVDRAGDVVARIRKALDFRVLSLSQIPDFDVAAAHRLYTTILAPVQKGWEGAGDLIFVVNGPLGQIPLGILTTAPAGVDKGTRPLFSGYRDIPWLINQAAISRLPSAAALLSLRARSGHPPARLAFAGFGDPFFNRQQATRAAMPAAPRRLAARGGSVHIRGVRVVEDGQDLDQNKAVASGRLAILHRLPDTSEELRRIALALGSDPAADLFLGTKASESRVKAMDLSDRRVIAFATHALVAGDLDGLAQPALALSSPAVTGETDDGLLTLEEVLKLRLNADWVVLSACNTGAADGKGAEAVSGLGRAFFYAGARALLATMWSVETSSAAALTTSLFTEMAGRPDLSRSQALRKAILDLISGPGLIDPASGKIAASHAHPFFWAPFILAGENGQGRH